MRKAERELLRYCAGKYRPVGWRTVNIILESGLKTAVAAPYYARRAGGKNRKGFYPAFTLMGIFDRCTSAIASIASMFVAALSSLEEAKSMLTQHGINLDIKTIRDIAKAFARRAKATQGLDELTSMQFQDQANIKGRRVVISTDGGRIRIRKNKRGPKTKKKRARYHTDWREPKVIIIYVVGENGRMDKKVAPILDATMSGPDDVFALMAYYLERILIQAADKVLFVVDGALWTWDRVKKLIDSLGIKSAQFYELLDFYHAVEHIAALARLVKRWSSSTKKTWVAKIRRRFLKGKTAEALKEIKEVVGKSRNKDLKRERDFFLKNANRLHYANVSAAKFPNGSGAMESAVRRVINLRMKGPGIFWHEDTAEEVMFLRCFYKAGRWSELVELAKYTGMPGAQPLGGEE